MTTNGDEKARKKRGQVLIDLMLKNLETYNADPEKYDEQEFQRSLQVKPLKIEQTSALRGTTKRDESAITLDIIGRFHARGMRRLHAFDVRFAGRRRVYRGEIWAAKDGRLLVRFNCPTESDYDEAHEIRGLTASDLSQAELDANAPESDDVWLPWVPLCVRERWNSWLSSVI